METNELLNNLFQEYVKELTLRYKTDPKYKGLSVTPTENAVKMFNAIHRNAVNGGRNAWLPYNQALKVACKKVGITKDAELRALLGAKSLHEVAFA